MAPLDEFIAQLRSVKPVLGRCAYCDFTASGPVDETRRLFAEHECDRPKCDRRRVTATKRRRRGYSLR